MRITFGGAITQMHNFKKNLFKIKHLQKKGFEISVFDGPDLCKWNGGRVNEDITLTDEIIDFYNSNNIGVNLTFTNNIIDINDEIGNKLLKQISKSNLNGVILVNMKLYNHIKSNYPNLKLTHSFTSYNYTLNDYKKIENDFDYIVPKTHLYFLSYFYNHIDIKKYELWVDEQCINCEKINYHYDTISEINRKYSKPYDEKGSEFCKSWNDCILPDYNNKNNYNLKYFNKETIDKLKKIGYCNFKIPGRDFDSERFDKIIKDVYDFFK